MRRLAGKHAATIAIIALLALNVVLIVPLFMGRNDVPDGTAAASSPDTPSESPAQDSASPSPGDVSSASSGVRLRGGQPRRILAVNSDQIAWRAEPAPCGEDSNIEVTTDGGKTWRPTDSGLKSVVRLKAFGDSSVFAIGADEHCQPAYAVAAYPGAAWHRDDSLLADTWFRVPGDLDTVHDPQDETSQPCGKEGLVDLAGLGTAQATALCVDGSLRIRDGGAEWHTAVQKSDAVALNADDKRFVMAEVNDRCTGLVVRAFSLHRDALEPKREHCVTVSSADPGAVAVSRRFGSTWVWSGDAVKTTP